MFFRRRQVWLPTFPGALLLLAFMAALFAFLVPGIGRFLSLDDPAAGPDGRGAQTLVVEGWMNPDDLAQAVAAIRRGRYERVLTTGGPIEPWNDAGAWKTFAERAAVYLKTQGVSNVTAIPAPASAQERTFLSAVQVRDWAASSGVRLAAIDLYSTGAHARRSRALYRMAFGPTVEVGVLAATPHGYDPARWWATSEGAKSVISESLGLVWTACCFWPPPPGSPAEHWGVPKNPG